jgi:D-sedoheptulose 7-phosphate isomerase
MRPIDLDERRAKREAAGRRAGALSLSRAELISTLQSYLWTVRETIDALPIGEMARVAEEMLRARAAGNTVYVFGNGGSAATASHAATNWQKPSHDDDEGRMKTVSLVDNVALLTAWANDSSFENVFAAQLRSLLEPGDVVFAISGSGNSPNVLRAVEAARRAGAVTIGLSGFAGGALDRIVDISVVVPCDSQEAIEDAHMMLVHALSMVLKQSVEVPEGRHESEQRRARSVAG